MMKVLKRIGWILLALLVIFVVLAFVLPTKHNVEVTKEVKAPKTYIYNAINDLKAHEYWSPWKTKDPSIEMDISNPSAGKGAVYTWTSEKSGNGRYEITESKEDEMINSLVTFEGQGDGIGTFMIKEKDKNTCDVTWRFDFESGRFMNVLMPLFIPNMKKTFKLGLENLSEMLDRRIQKQSYYGIDVQAGQMPLRNFVLVRSEIDQDNVGQFSTRSITSLFQKLQSADIAMDGEPVSLIYDWREQGKKVDFGVAIPVADAIAIDGVLSQTIDPSRTAFVEFIGDDVKLKQVHLAIQSYLKDHKLLYNRPIVIENKAEHETNPEKWVRKVIYTIAQ